MSAASVDVVMALQQQLAETREQMAQMHLMQQQQAAVAVLEGGKQLASLEALRKNDLRIQEEKMKKSPANQRLIKMILATQWKVENMASAWTRICGGDPMKVDTTGDIFTLPLTEDNLEQAGGALLLTLQGMKDISEILAAQKTLVEAAHNSSLGWAAATHMEKGRFS